MLAKSGVKVVLGTGSIGDASDPLAACNTAAQTQEFFNIFRKHGGDELDSARGYSPNAPHTSEPLVGQTDASTWARISTKVDSRPGDQSKQGIENSIDGSLQALQMPSVYIDYLHLPDPNTPLEETLAAMDAAHRAGKFKHFGISNFLVDQVREVLAICEEKGYVKPAVYQGQYNAIARKAEEELIPLLREHSITFYAWSPAAGGFFKKDNHRMSGDDNTSKRMQAMYAKPSVQAAFARIHKYADESGTTGHAIALRWVLHHSTLKGESGDAIVVGARTNDQLESTMQICADDPLPQSVVELINEIAVELKEVAPGFTPFG